MIQKKRDYPRIGGWLALLIVWMIILRPLAGIYLWKQMRAQRLADLTPDNDWLVNTSVFWLIFLGVAALSIYGGWRLLRDHTPGAVKAAIVILWLTTPVASVALFISQALLAGSLSWIDAARVTGTNVLVALVWTVYLMRSRRVKKIYFAQAD